MFESHITTAHSTRRMNRNHADLSRANQPIWLPTNAFIQGKSTLNTHTCPIAKLTQANVQSGSTITMVYDEFFPLLTADEFSVLLWNVPLKYTKQSLSIVHLEVQKNAHDSTTGKSTLYVYSSYLKYEGQISIQDECKGQQCKTMRRKSKCSTGRRFHGCRMATLESYGHLLYILAFCSCLCRAGVFQLM